MNKSAIQKFAVRARTALMEQVAQRAYQYGVTAEGFGEERAVAVNGQVLTAQEQQQRRELVLEIRAKGYAQVMEEVAYTWFNRFIALRFMEVNNYLPSHIRVFSDSTGAFKPEILNDVLHLDLPGLDSGKVAEYIESNDTEALYRYLLLTQCNALNGALPKMFEEMGGYTELLFPNHMLRPDSVLAHMVADIPEDDWRDAVQIIGWLYQYYNTEPKAQVFADLKKNIKISRESIPAATQLFTPDWIVRYMVENSLGRLWLEGHPNAALRGGWKYYLDEAQQEPEVEAQLAKLREDYKTIRPEDIRVIDPCMGSGHILVYAFDVLMQIYTAAGWDQREAAQSILKNNLYGLDIDDRAAQLAYFAVMMKARQYNRRFLTRGIQPNVYSPEGYVDGREFGSLLAVETLEPCPEPIEEQSLFEESYERQLNTWNFRRLLAQKYDVVVTNPPYMGASGMGAKLSEFVKKNYPDSKSDLFACFIERGFQLANVRGFVSMITMESWMFLSSFEKMRQNIMRTHTIVNMVHMPYLGKGGTSLGINFGTAAVIFNKYFWKDYSSQFDYIRYYETDNEGVPFAFPTVNERYKATKVSNFSKIPGSPVAYWVSNAFLRAFNTGVLLGKIADAKQGVATADNYRFLRLWNEVSINKVSFHTHSHEEAATAREKWFPYNKGGDFRKWYGNNEFVVNWEHDGAELKQFKGSVLRNPSYYFKECFSWSLISSSVAAFRYKPAGQIFDVAGMSCFASEKQLNYLLALCNTKVVMIVLEVIAPTINYQCGDIANIPVIQDGDTNDICEVTQDNISISKTDWDSYETSWDFKKHPLI